MSESSTTRRHLSALGKAWVNFWNEREPATMLAFVRICVAAALLQDMLIVAQLDLVDVIFGDADHWNLGEQMTRSKSHAYALFGRAFEAPRLLFMSTTAALTLFGLGALTRLSGVYAIFGLRTLGLLYVQGDRGIDMMLRIILALLVMSQSHATLSIDAWVRHRRFARPNALIPAWPRYLITLQTLWMYFSAGINKTNALWWWQGDYMALHYVIRYPHFMRWDMSWVPAWVTQIGTFATMTFELSAPAMILSAWILRRREAKPLRLFRRVWIGMGLSFHLSLTLVMNIGLFTFGMMALYPAFISARQMRRAPSKWLRFSGAPLPQEDMRASAETPRAMTR